MVQRMDSRSFAIGVILGITCSSLTTYMLLLSRRAFEKKDKWPAWAEEMANSGAYGQLVIRMEWDASPSWRWRNGWQGTDYCHNKNSDGVRILAYYFNHSDQVLTGLLHFGPGAESHRGFCHGGSMTAVMDDLIGWAAFLATGKVWQGYTVQVDTSLRKPIAVGEYLQGRARITTIEGRKVFVEASILNPVDGKVHCEGSGLTILVKD